MDFSLNDLATRRCIRRKYGHIAYVWWLIGVADHRVNKIIASEIDYIINMYSVERGFTLARCIYSLSNSLVVK